MMIVNPKTGTLPVFSIYIATITFQRKEKTDISGKTAYEI